MSRIIGEIELHSVTGIEECFKQLRKSKWPHPRWALIYELTREYTRSPRFKEYVKTFVAHGLIFDDRPLLAILLDDANALRFLLENHPEIVRNVYTLRCAYTPWYQVTLLHIVLNLTTYLVLLEKWIFIKFT